jgi:hypothetical protein
VNNSISAESPEGNRAVPREPTQTMIAAAYGAGCDLHEDIGAIWRAMYDAAPRQPEQPQETSGAD